jgi:hypothetical protein
VTENDQADGILEEFDFLRDTAVDSPERVAERLEERAWELVDNAPPVRVSYAAQLLGVREQSLRPWLDRGILDVVKDTSPVRVTLASLAELREVVDDLRADGEDRNVIRAAIDRLESDALRRHPRFSKSVEQMKRGQRESEQFEEFVLANAPEFVAGIAAADLELRAGETVSLAQFSQQIEGDGSDVPSTRR